MTKKEIIQGGIMLLIIALVIGYGLYSSYSDTKQLDTCSQDTTGEIVSIKRRLGKSHVVHYVYTTNEGEHNASAPITNEYNLKKVRKLKTLSVEYSCDNHHVSRLKFSK